ncbi:response regulator [Brucellaceae bacterium C25G]
MRILVVEDDPILMDGLSAGLNIAGFTVDAVACCEDAYSALAVQSYNALVLDLMLPDGSGLDILAHLRRNKNDLPVLLLTARDQVADRITGLDAGADDYVGKPFDLDELAARIRAIARRSNGRSSGTIEWKDVVLDPAHMTVQRGETLLKFTRREFTVLRTLMERPNATLSKTTLEEALYGWQEEVESNAVEVHIHHLRAKLGSQFIKTVRGIGYRLAEQDQ